MHKFKRDLEAKRLEKGKIYAFCEKLKTNYEIFAFIDNIKMLYHQHQHMEVILNVFHVFEILVTRGLIT